MLIVLLTLPQCTSRKPIDDVRLPKVLSSKEVVLVSEGVSLEPSFSPQGDKLLFVSAGRPGHPRSFQVYEKDLRSGAERRITFQNGNTASPIYSHKPNWIIYASSTDEDKEAPPRLYTPTEPSPLPVTYQSGQEIYAHSLEELEIQRLTRNPGFDGDLQLAADGKSVLFTRAQGRKLESLILNTANGQVRPPKGPKTPFSSYVESRDKHWRAWVEWDAAFGVSRLILQKDKAPPQELAPDLVVNKMDLRFSPDSKWLLWAQFNPASKTFQIWSQELDTGCARRLTDNTDTDRRSPTLSLDNRQLVYSAGNRDRSRIVQTPFGPPSGPCLQAPQAVP